MICEIKNGLEDQENCFLYLLRAFFHNIIIFVFLSLCYMLPLFFSQVVASRLKLCAAQNKFLTRITIFPYKGFLVTLDEGERPSQKT